MAAKKKRAYFSSLPKFSDYNELIISVTQNKSLKKKYNFINPVETGIQNCIEVAGTYITTDNPRLIHTSVLHVEGGWPKDINRTDEEQTSRYRKKQEKDERYLIQLKGLIKSCEHAIYQNNAVNLYENYFEELEEIDLKEDYSSKTVNVYKDKYKRQVSKIVWTPDNPYLFASCHWGTQTYGNYQIGESNTTNIWDIEFPKGPLRELNCHAQAPCLEYNPRDTTCILTGLITGQIAVYDVRDSSDFPHTISMRENSHRDRVNALSFYTSKTNTEFFSGSSYGEIFWWDLRNMEMPIETLLLEPVKMNAKSSIPRAYGVNVLEYESTIPNKYMVGVESGVVFTCNKKFKTPNDRIYSRITAYSGTVNAVQRNPSFLKFFLTVGDFQAKIWCEELKDSPVFWTKEYQSELIAGCWNPVRCSSFYISRRDGVLDAWDVIKRSDRPVLSVKLSDDPLNSLSPHKEGKYVATGNSSGKVYLVQLSENLATTTINDRPAMAVVLDRETRREKLLENKQRELKLKEKEKEREKMRIKLGLADPEEVEMNLANELAKQSEVNFFQLIQQLKS